MRGFNDYHPADAQSGWEDLYVDYFYGMNVEGVDSGSTGDPNVYDPIAFPQCNVNLDPWNTTRHLSFHGFRNSQVRHPADKLFLCDAMYWWVNEYGSGVKPGWKGLTSNYDLTGERQHTTAVSGGATANDGSSYNSERTVAWRHKKMFANVCFFDGHVEPVRKDRFTTRDAANNLIPNYTMWRVNQ